MSRRTYTSPEVKDRWNRKHYEQILLRVAKGGRETVQQLAELRGLSVSAYVRHLIIHDAETLGKGDISAIIGGGVTNYDQVDLILSRARRKGRT